MRNSHVRVKRDIEEKDTVILELNEQIRDKKDAMA